ncbi:MAG: DegT/DnrJ/EryC1/StrS family aminotransferase [Candidatus Obscuribacter sp.]|nr:DegT/DnrJ/EryC1/StrS family aminotransferase [Candidatus Obscuribacter sp.]
MERSFSANSFIEKLKAKGVCAVFHYIPLHSSPYGKRAGRTIGEMKNTCSVSERLVRLPLWLGLEDEQRKVIQNVIELFN